MGLKLTAMTRVNHLKKQKKTKNFSIKVFVSTSLVMMVGSLALSAPALIDLMLVHIKMRASNFFPAVNLHYINHEF